MKFAEDYSSFTLENADKTTGLYYPLASEAGLRSCVTPFLTGDSKLDQNTFLLEPASIEDLTEKRHSRNFWVLRPGKSPWSCSGSSVWQMAEDRESSTVTAGLMWHRIERTSGDKEIKASVLSFIPYDKLCEIHVVTLRNTSDRTITLRFASAIPIYGRSADNLRDHRHVTSLLNRIYVTDRGVSTVPTLSFDERGHKENHVLYYVESIGENGEKPESFYPEIRDFVKEGGNLEKPLSLLQADPGVKPGYTTAGGEAMGAMIFKETLLKPDEELVYITFAGLTDDAAPDKANSLEYRNLSDVNKAFEKTKVHWAKKAVLKVHTGDKFFDGFMHYVSFQPELRRLFGCSFLPHHDYGRGGRGFRDLWQDCLALVLFDPGSTSDLLFNNFKGVRTDGTNATIIGNKPGEFKADRNNIPRVWMDHGFWPLLTLKLYMDQTGDMDFLLKETSYYQDDSEAEPITGTVIEHLLIQNLSRCLDLGSHNMMRLRGADWNDALDMAPDKGESVSFTHAYAGNLKTLAELLRVLKKQGTTALSLLQDIDLLLAGKPMGRITGKKKDFDTAKLAETLDHRADDLFTLLRKQEWINEDGCGRFNGYYDNKGKALERGDTPQMTLTGQVFAIMSGVATDEMISEIVRSADLLLYDENHGGYRLNTDFKEGKPDMGRAFFFAYGEKENGAVFSHMAVMYAYALYSRGFAKEGFKALNALYKQSMNFETSRIYPGIPEYFGKGGRGLYQFLTGAASWYVYTVVTEMYGIRGDLGKLVIEPKLMADQFDEFGRTDITLPFNGHTLYVEYVNCKHLEYGDYRIAEATLNNEPFAIEGGKKGILADTSLLKDENHITIYLA